MCIVTLYHLYSLWLSYLECGKFLLNKLHVLKPIENKPHLTRPLPNQEFRLSVYHACIYSLVVYTETAIMHDLYAPSLLETQMFCRKHILETKYKPMNLPNTANLIKAIFQVQNN